MRRASLIFLLAALAAVGTLRIGAGQDLPFFQSALEPVATGGLEAVDRSLARLSRHRRLLVIGAHPDDEDTTILALMGRVSGGEAAYLSLTRGEGGQNLIGPELEVGLGLVRTGELLAARRVERTRQYFTRAYDFGYTRSLEEVWERWPRREILEDVVRIVRRFRPQIIVAAFPGDERAGHGQHQAAGVLAVEAFEQSGDPDRYPELTAAGLVPWQPSILLRRSLWWLGEETEIETPLGVLDPLTGQSVVQIAAESRSQHRSQDMGMLQPLGGLVGGFEHLAGAPVEDGSDLFGTLDDGLTAIAELAPAGALRNQLIEELAAIESLAVGARSRLSPVEVAGAVPSLREISDRLATAVALCQTEDMSSDRSRFLVDLLEEKRNLASEGLLAAAGIAVDVVADRSEIPVGGTATVTAEFWNAGTSPAELEAVEIRSRDGWQAEAVTLEIETRIMKGVERRAYRVRVPGDAQPTVPYFTALPRRGDLYDWDGVREEVRGRPLQPPPLVAEISLRFEGLSLRVRREVVHRYRDQALGEIRQPVRAVPAIEVVARPSLVIWPVGSASRRAVEIELGSHLPRPVTGRLALESASWSQQAAIDFRIDDPEGSTIIAMPLELPPGAPAGRHVLRVWAALKGGERFGHSYPVLEYPHIRPLVEPRPAAIDVQVLELGLPDVRRVGYVRGASDRVPEVLQEIGLPVEVVSGAELGSRDLTEFDVIVIGARAYESDAGLGSANKRLLSWVEQGGRLVVQYQQYAFIEGGFAPGELEIGSPHGRVTDEGSPVRVLVPEHPFFSSPNRIERADWEDWVQERGLYFPSSWDPGFRPLLELNDPMRSPEQGALLIRDVGRGTWVYTGLSFFRQLPAGVPGALRLFVNLLAVGES